MNKDVNTEIEDLLKDSKYQIKDIFSYTVDILLSNNENIALLKQYFIDNPLKLKILVSSLESILKGTNNFYKYESSGYFSNVEKDIYYYVSSFSNFIPDFEYNSKALRPLIKVLKFLYELDHTKFETVIIEDYQKVIYSYFMVGYKIDFPYNVLEKFLKSDDKIIQNGALFYLINKLESLLHEKDSLENRNENVVDINKLINNEITHISKVLCTLPEDKKIELVIDYYFHIHRNDSLALKLNNQFINYPMNLTEIIQNRIEINNPYTFTKLIPILSRPELKELFTKELISWFKKDFNKIIWEEIKNKVIKSLEINNISINNELINIKLFITDFDRQVRYSKYIKDIEKSKAINNIINIG